MSQSTENQDTPTFTEKSVQVCKRLERSLRQQADNLDWRHEQARYFRNKLKRIVEGEGPSKQRPQRFINALNHIRSSSKALWTKQDHKDFDHLNDLFTNMHIRSRRTLLDHSSDGLSPAVYGADTASEENIDTVIDKYAIKKKLGEGNMGVVYLAFNPDIDCFVALKKMRLGLRAKYMQAFLKEAKAAGKINSPYCVKVFDVIQHRVENVPVIVSEYVDGINAEDFLELEAFESLSPARAFSIPAALLILEQMLKGLRAVHAAHIIHQDLKPENYMVARPIVDAIHALYMKHGSISHSDLEKLFFEHRHEAWLKLHDWGLAVEKVTDPIEAHFIDSQETVENSTKQLRWLKCSHFDSEKQEEAQHQDSGENFNLDAALADPRPLSGLGSEKPRHSMVLKKINEDDLDSGIDEELLTSNNIGYNDIPNTKRGGTPIYMAPEQLSNRGISRTTDVFALGLIFYSLLTGQSAKKARHYSIGLTERMFHDFSAFLKTMRESEARYAVDVKTDPGLLRLIEHKDVLELLQLMCARARSERVSSHCVLTELDRLLSQSDPSRTSVNPLHERSEELFSSGDHRACQRRIFELEQELAQLRQTMRRVSEDLLRAADGNTAPALPPQMSAEFPIVDTEIPATFTVPLIPEDPSPPSDDEETAKIEREQIKVQLHDAMETREMKALKLSQLTEESSEPVDPPEIIATPELNPDEDDGLTESKRAAIKVVEAIPDIHGEICKEILTGEMTRAPLLEKINATIAQRLVDEELKKLELDQISTLSVEAAHVLARQKGSLSLNGLKKLSPELAAALANHGGRQLFLNGLTEIDPDVAERLANYKQSLRLSGLQELTDQVCGAFRDFEGDWLVFGGLTKLSSHQAHIMSEYKCHLKLNGLDELSEDVAENLSGLEQNLSLDGLTSITVGPASCLARHGAQLSLKGLSALDASVAAVLSAHRGKWLILDGLKALSSDTAEELATYHGGLSLNGLANLEKDCATQLKGHRGKRLSLNGLKSVAGISSIITRFRGYLQLDGLKSLNARDAKYLARHKGKLSLKGVQKMTEKAVDELNAHKGPLYVSRRFKKAV